MPADSGYFAKFPKVVYGGRTVLDLTRRVRVADSTLRTPQSFYPYEMRSGMRADHISFDYYNDPDAEWVIYLSSGIVDPYYGWYLTEEELNSYVDEKYGSIEDAQERVSHWVVNWESAVNFDVSPSYFENQLTETLKKYWTPVYGQGKRVLSYARRRSDWTAATNWIERLTTPTSVDWVEGTLLNFRVTPDGENVGHGELVRNPGTGALDVQHLRGLYQSGYYVVPRDTGSATVTIESVERLTTGITLDELAYWEPVYHYDLERERNEANKHLTLIDVDYVSEMVQETKRLLQL